MTFDQQQRFMPPQRYCLQCLLKTLCPRLVPTPKAAAVAYLLLAPILRKLDFPMLLVCTVRGERARVRPFSDDNQPEGL